jgi:hypothetical protein
LIPVNDHRQKLFTPCSDPIVGVIAGFNQSHVAQLFGGFEIKLALIWITRNVSQGFQKPFSQAHGCYSKGSKSQTGLLAPIRPAVKFQSIVSREAVAVRSLPHPLSIYYALHCRCDQF